MCVMVGVCVRGGVGLPKPQPRGPIYDDMHPPLSGSHAAERRPPLQAQKTTTTPIIFFFLLSTKQKRKMLVLVASAPAAVAVLGLRGGRREGNMHGIIDRPVSWRRPSPIDRKPRRAFRPGTYLPTYTHTCIHTLVHTSLPPSIPPSMLPQLLLVGAGAAP